MISSTVRILGLCALGALSAATAARAADSSVPIPVESFFANPGFSGAKLSPNARYLAVRIGSPEHRDGLAVVELETSKATRVAFFSDIDIGHFQWVNNERLAFDTTDKQLAQGQLDRAPGLYAVNRDGSNLRQLVDRQSQYGVFQMRSRVDPRMFLPWNTYMLSEPGAQDSEYIYATSPHYEGLGEIKYVDLVRIDTLTGRSQTVPRPGFAMYWLLDQKGEPRVAVTVERDQESVQYRDPASGEWRKLGSFPVYIGSRGGFDPLAFGPDGTLYVTTRAGSDKETLNSFDLAANRVNPVPLVKLADYDFTGSLVMDKDKLLGVHYLADARGTSWLDPRMKAVQDTVDRLLPGTVNEISIGVRAETPWVLVRAYSDVLPSTYLLFNTETKKFNKVGESHPAIDPARMGRQQALRYKARDGLEIPALLTLPHGSNGKNLPLVVLVHGGPYLRGSEWGWDADSQFLASRGYAVLEPEYRGSTGFGWKHYKAGWKQWGLAMQDDIADGARALIAQGTADPKRICIAGASYGGYATLMGLVNDPDLYKCGVDWVGVSDIKLMYTGHWSFQSDLSERWKDYGMPVLIGDQAKDAAQLKATSPLEQAARIKQPLLLAYGGSDYRVPIYHGKKFYDAIKTSNPDVEWIEYQEEGHGWRLPKNRYDFWTRVEKFLDRNIGKP